MRVLIVDDSKDLNNSVSKYLKNYGYETESAYDGQKGLRLALANDYDVVLLDVMMPQINGYKVLERLRAEGRNTPVIMITAKTEITDRIEGLERGADDYLQKPFNMNELLARIKAVCRRSHISCESNIMKYADITLTVDTRKLATEDLQITLNQCELDIVIMFIKNSSVIVDEERLREIYEKYNSEASLDECIERLEKKLNYIGSKIKLIRIRGIGYKMCA